jgi:quinol-cytochrome oxidoreductase complex cytochrome b subunit
MLWMFAPDIVKLAFNHIITYPTPLNSNYLWSFGSLVGIFFALQILIGVFGVQTWYNY